MIDLRRGNAGAVPWGLMGWLVLIAAVETTVRRHALEVSNPLPTSWGYARTEAARQGPRGEILCFGTSLVKNGVLPRIIAKQTGRRTFNLAVFNGPSPASYFLFQRALAAGSAPCAVLLDCQDEPIARDRTDGAPDRLGADLRQWPELLGPWDAFELASTARDPDFLAAFWLARLVPSFQARFEVRNSLRANLRGEDGSSRATMLMLMRNWRENQGAQLLPRTEGASTVAPHAAGPTRHSPLPRERVAAEQPGEGESGRGREGMPSPGPSDHPLPRERVQERWENHPLSATYARKFLDRAAARGIRVFWLLPPLGPDHQARRIGQGLDGYYTRRAREVHARYAGVTVIDARRSGYDQDAFWDGVHLDRQGAVTFSTDVADVVADVLNHPNQAPRWIALRAYRPLPTSVPVEDVAESRLAIQDTQGVRR